MGDLCLAENAFNLDRLLKPIFSLPLLSLETRGDNPNGEILVVLLAEYRCGEGVLALRLLPKKPFAPLISRFKRDLVSCHAIILRLGGCCACEVGRDLCGTKGDRLCTLSLLVGVTEVRLGGRIWSLGVLLAELGDGDF